MSKTSKTLILFDVDGTLTPSRLTIGKDMEDTLKKLKRCEKIDIGIVGGSDLNKQKEQLGEENLKQFDYVFSENGLCAFHNNTLLQKTSFLDYIGENNMKNLINKCLYYLSTIDIPVKRGNFIEFRTGMINVSPIGRSCSQEERIQFYEIDKIEGIRSKMVDYLKKELADLNLTFSLGGQISIDIFPKGWDKTYCLSFVENKYDSIHFFGDKTSEGGNDYEIYNDPRIIGHTVVSPEDTISQLTRLFF